MITINDHLSTCEECWLRYEEVARPAEQFPFALVPLRIEEDSHPIPSLPLIRWGPAFAVISILCGSIFFLTVYLKRQPADHRAPSVQPARPVKTNQPTSLTTQPRPDNPTTTSSPQDQVVEPHLAPRPARSQSVDSTNKEHPLVLNQRPAILAEIVRQPSVTLKGTQADVEFAVLGPAGTVVMDQRPTFRWEKVPGATSYRVIATDVGSREIVLSETVTTPLLVPTKPLPRGKILSWGVTALVNGEEIAAPRPPASEARVKVLESDKADRLTRQLKAHGASPVARGVLYAREGLLDDAEREFKAVLTTNPRSVAARKFLRIVQSWRSAQSQ